METALIYILGIITGVILSIARSRVIKKKNIEKRAASVQAVKRHLETIKWNMQLGERENDFVDVDGQGQQANVNQDHEH